MKESSLLLCDFYKICHRKLYPKGTEFIYSNFTPRSNKYFTLSDKVVAFGFQGFITKYLINHFNENFFSQPKEEVVAEYEYVIKNTLMLEQVETDHIEALHDLGYLPIRIDAIEEGTQIPMKVPVLTIENTHKDFFWVTNYLETLISNELWQPMTSATISKKYKEVIDEASIKTTGSKEGTEFIGHDFSMRGMSSLETTKLSGAGHLLSFLGTDSIPAILYLRDYYNAVLDKQIVGTSISATEHSIMSALTPANSDRNELEAFKYLINEAQKDGFLSIVSDTYDFWEVIENILPQLKEDIMNRNGKVVIRPDTGIPEKILCGRKIIDFSDSYDDLKELIKYIKNYMKTGLEELIPHDEDLNVIVKFKEKYYKAKHENQWNFFEEYIPSLEDLGLIESLWNIFGGTINEKGYKVLDPHIGAIYGDSITIERTIKINELLEAKGFASTNVVLGIGSYTYQYNTRDTFGFAMKATSTIKNGQEIHLKKEPKTDDGTKLSSTGRLYVYEEEDEIKLLDGLTKQELIEKDKEHPNLLKPLFLNGKLLRETSLSEIRERLGSFK